MPNKVYLTKEFTFDAAHHLPNYEGKCRNKHGHTYKLEVKVVGDISCDDMTEYNPAIDFMVIDFADLEKIVNDKVMFDHDHADLNKIYLFPTVEVMAVEIFNRIKQGLREHTAFVNIMGVKLWETPTCYAEYFGESISHISDSIKDILNDKDTMDGIIKEAWESIFGNTDSDNAEEDAGV